MEMVEHLLPIKADPKLLGRGLVIPRVLEDKSFKEEERFLLDVDTGVAARIDLSLQILQFAMGAEGIIEQANVGPEGQCIPEESLSLIDWNDAYLKLLAHKDSKVFDNLVVLPGSPQKVIKQGDCKLIADDSVMRPTSFALRQRLQDGVVSLVLKYAERFYWVKQERWESKNMAYHSLDHNDTNYQDYIVKIPENDKELRQEVQELINEGRRIYKEESQTLPNIHFDRHLYQPLLIIGRDQVQTEPPGLNEGEQGFVKDLRRYCLQGERRRIPPSYEVSLTTEGEALMSPATFTHHIPDGPGPNLPRRG